MSSSQRSYFCPACWRPIIVPTEKCPNCGFRHSDTSWLDKNYEGLVIADGKYRIMSPVGVGGGGCVALAKQYVSGIDIGTVAIKFPWHADLLENPTHVLEEATAIRRAHHPNIVALHDAFIDTGVPYLVLEYIRDAQLYHEFLNYVKNDICGLLEVWIQICDAIDSLHHKGALHCDIKPGNIAVLPWVCDTRYFAKILDFGIASLWDKRRGWQAKGLGTLGFAAPEQLLGHPTPRSDVFSFGVLMYWTLTGVMPFDPLLSHNPDAFIHSPIPELGKGFPPELNQLVRECIDPVEKRRYPRMPTRPLKNLVKSMPESRISAGESLLTTAKDTFINAGLARPYSRKAQLYRRSAELFREAERLSPLPPMLKDMAEKAERFSRQYGAFGSRQSWFRKLLR